MTASGAVQKYTYAQLLAKAQAVGSGGGYAKTKHTTYVAKVVNRTLAASKKAGSAQTISRKKLKKVTIRV